MKNENFQCQQYKKIHFIEIYFNIYETHENLSSCMSEIIENMLP